MRFCRCLVAAAVVSVATAAFAGKDLTTVGVNLAVLGDTASPFAPFENGRFHYHDIHADYVSNEPALDSNAYLLVALLGVAQ